MRRFVVIGQRATASPDFSLADIAGTSGRIDILLRCLRAGLLFSHGIRRDTVMYLVMLGGPRAPRTLRFDGSVVRFIRPDERALGGMVKKALGVPCEGPGFHRVRDGIAIASGGLDAVLGDLGAATPYVLEEHAEDIRAAALDVEHPVFFIGDHLGFDEATRARLAALGAASTSVGPVSVHADDAITVVLNELDRRADR